ncbi:MAG: hypothetical protein AB7O88_25945 [Reyranellaceae bacterium]
MAIDPQCIAVGRRYRTPYAEMRRVTTIEDGDVVYTSVTPSAREKIAHFTHKRVPLILFALDVEREIFS